MNIRHATLEDVNAIADIEAICFPKQEAAGYDSILDRLTWYPNHFLVLEIDGKIVSFVDGMVTDERHLQDWMYEKACLHNEKGSWQMIFGVNTLPICRNKGYAGQLLWRIIKEAKEQNRKGLVLTCKQELISYYAKFGFVNQGVSDSKHGGVLWYEMVLKFE